MQRHLKQSSLSPCYIKKYIELDPIRGMKNLWQKEGED